MEDVITIRTQISLSEKDYAAAKAESARLGISLAELIRRSLRRSLRGVLPPAGQPAWMRFAGTVQSGEAARMAARGPIAHYRLSREEYANTVYDLLGVHYDADQPGGLLEDPRWHGFERIGALLSLAPSHVDRYLKAAETVVRGVREAGESPRSAYQAALVGILASKNFFYLEQGSADEPRAKLTDWELASRLSYFLWGSLPDEPLLAAARSGTLHQPEVLRSQVTRMIADPKIARFTDAFPRQWLQLHRVGMFPPDRKLYPDYDLWLEASMIEEPLRTFATAFQDNLPIGDLVAGDWSVVNARLAEHYQLPPLPQADFTRVTFAPEYHRGGLLTQAAILSLSSDGTRHRPVHRGVWVSEAIFGVTPPPPPPNVDALEPQPADVEKLTVRMQLAAHSNTAACAACHRKIDPLGFAFDNYDAIGRWRTHEQLPTGKGEDPPVDASGTLAGGKVGDTEKNTISVDQRMAEVTAPHTRFASLELSNQGRSLAWTADGILLPAESNPAVVFSSLFVEPAGGIDAQRRRLLKKESILDAVLDEARGLERRLGSADRGRLEQYLTSVREVEVRARRAEAWLDTPRPAIPADAAARLNRSIGLDKLGEYLRTMYDLIVLAFQTDMTRVVTFSTGEEGKGPSVPEIGITQDRHALSHHGGVASRLADLAASDRFNLEQLSYFLTRLGEARDAEGPLLDSTMVLFGSGMAYGHSHGNANLPLVLAGGSALGLKHGSHLDYNAAAGFTDYDAKLIEICHRPVDGRARMSNLLVTMAQRMGVEIESFGDATGVVSEVVA